MRSAYKRPNPYGYPYSLGRLCTERLICKYRQQACKHTSNVKLNLYISVSPLSRIELQDFGLRCSILLHSIDILHFGINNSNDSF